MALKLVHSGADTASRQVKGSKLHLLAKVYMEAPLAKAEVQSTKYEELLNISIPPFCWPYFNCSVSPEIKINKNVN